MGQKTLEGKTLREMVTLKFEKRKHDTKFLQALK